MLESIRKTIVAACRFFSWSTTEGRRAASRQRRSARAAGRGPASASPRWNRGACSVGPEGQDQHQSRGGDQERPGADRVETDADAVEHGALLCRGGETHQLIINEMKIQMSDRDVVRWVSPTLRSARPRPRHAAAPAGDGRGDSL